ncbi:LADA_0E14268g1_1 [Lachancea dasiensis]|uniref:LADA_0E14268g1_1 n=1 Tax=Lachancea dasiensis TaxID=1072105 RepID=A0A1G4JFX9_9SACH|nr:LADA_0E14268g1_1 [Lachancea dasiensis]
MLRCTATPRILRNGAPIVQKRNIMGFVRNALGLDPPPSPDEPTPANRFHPWDQSPSPDLRERAATIRAMAKCPVTGQEINYTCPISGIPTHHSREAWENDVAYQESTKPEILKKVNIYEHDLRSGRPFPEFDFPLDQDFDRMVNLTNWDLFFYTRGFYSMDTEFQLAAVTKMLSYPVTIGSVLHQFSPYSLNPKGPITLEGLKSLAALRYTLYPEQNRRVSSSTKNSPLRIFILGARAEAQLPGHVWKQLQYMFPETQMELHFVGPESHFDRNKREYVNSSAPIIRRVDETLSFVYHTDYFHVFHEAQDFFPYDPYTDIFFCFHPGFAAPESKENWMGKTMEALLETKCAIFTTGFNEADLKRDMDAVVGAYGKEVDMLMEPSKNVFGSTKWELNDVNPQQVYQFNMYMAGFRGKRYHAIEV